MQTERTERSISSTLLDYIPHYLMVGIVLLFLLDYLSPEGITGARYLEATAPKVYLIMVPIAAIALIRARLRDVSQRTRGWQYAIIMMGFFFASIIIGLSQPELEYGALYSTWYDTFKVNGFEASWGLTFLFMVRLFVRQIRMRNLVTVWLGFIVITTMLGLTPFSDLLMPQLGEWSRWVTTYPSTASDITFYWGTSMAIVVLWVNMILRREKMRPPV